MVIPSFSQINLKRAAGMQNLTKKDTAHRDCQVEKLKSRSYFQCFGQSKNAFYGLFPALTNRTTNQRCLFLDLSFKSE